MLAAKDLNEKRKMCITRFNLEIMMGEDADEIISKVFNSFLHIYRWSFQTKKSEFVPDFANGMLH